MSGVPIQCGTCPNDERCCMLDILDDDDRSWGEWFGDVFFNPLMWTIIISIAIGVAGVCFYIGVLGFTSAVSLIHNMTMAG